MPNYVAVKDSLPNNPTRLEIANAVLNIRSKKLPDLKVFPNVGSFFINPVVDNTKAKKLRNKIMKFIGIKI